MPSGAGVRKFLLQEDARTFPWFPQVTFSVGLDKGLRTDPILNYLVANASVCVGWGGGGDIRFAGHWVEKNFVCDRAHST